MWTPTPSEDLEREITAALARPGASRALPPRPVAHAHADGSGWLWGRLRTGAGGWLGLASIYRGYFFDGAALHWYPAGELRPLD